MLCVLVLSCCLLPVADEATSVDTRHPGYRFLVEKAYVPPDFDREVFENLWKVWEEPLRTQARAADSEGRRRLAFARYGMTAAPGRPGDAPLQYVPTGSGFSMNCFACHGGKVAGKVIPGAPNSLWGLATLVEDIRNTKIRLGKPLAHLELGSIFVPLGENVGTTNAVVFGLLLGARRDRDLNYLAHITPPSMLHHDMDAPPWWNVKKKKRIYIDGFAANSHRALMQFMLVEENGPEKFREWEKDFEQVSAWIRGLEAPRYPWPIDQAKVARGAVIFNRACAECHGRHGADAHYPEVTIPIDDVGTDRARLDAITPKARQEYGEGWFSFHGDHEVVADPGGYVAPPLDGVWASAPYLHNGSVPTLWHLLRPDARPAVWRRIDDDAYDTQHVGLKIEELSTVPSKISRAEKRRVFDTKKFGKSAVGHRYPESLNESEKDALLEYLKTL